MAAASEGIADGALMAAAAPAAPLCTAVRVAVRVRPMVEKEARDGSGSCVFVEDGHLPQQIVVLNKAFKFDVAFSPGVTQDAVYEATAKPLLEKFFQGFNATVLAYGQTGSGKTFTMGSTLGPGPNDESAGIIPRLLQDIFGHMAENRRRCVASGKGEEGNDACPWRLRLSYLEIYKEEVKDLLRSQSEGQGHLQSLKIREDAGGAGMMVAGLSLHEVQSLEAVSELLYRGTLRRSTASTKMNMHSSRSHAVCTLYLEGNVGDKQVTSKFHLVDLAGSERAKRTCAEGDRLQEGITINCALFALGNVISALTDPKRRGVNGGSGHVPYRDAKITRLLQDSLGGNSYTMMIACVSPAYSNMDETVNTLRYAERARTITNMAKQNCMVGSDQSQEVANLKEEVKLLKLQLAQARSTGATGGGGGGLGDGAAAELLGVLKEENKRLRETVKDLERTARGASEEAVMAASRLECLTVQYEQLCALAKEAGLELPPGLDGGDRAALPMVEEFGREGSGDGGAAGDGHELQQQGQAAGEAEEEPETESDVDEEDDDDEEEDDTALSSGVSEESETETESAVDEDDDDDDDEDDSDYDPQNSPSQQGKAGSSRRGKEDAHQKQAPKGMGRGKDGEEERASIEDDIDALLSDTGDEWVPEEPLFRYTCDDLKTYLKAAKLPTSGKKVELMQRVRDHRAKARRAEDTVESSNDSVFSASAHAPPPAKPLPRFKYLMAGTPTATAAAQPLEKTLARKLVASSNTTSLSSAVATPSTTASATAPKVTSKTAAPEPPRPRQPLADLKNRSAASASGAYSLIKPATTRSIL